ncbi:hypothetical protein [Streptomyces bobili]
MATTSSTSIRTDLELAVREERDHLKGIVQRGLGQQLEQVASKNRAGWVSTGSPSCTIPMDFMMLLAAGGMVTGMLPA